MAAGMFVAAAKKLAKKHIEKKARQKINNIKEDPGTRKKAITAILISSLIVFILMFAIISAWLGLIGKVVDTIKDGVNTVINWFTGEEEHITTLTIGEDGLFKTKAKKEWHLFTTNTYKYYAVLDEEAFRKYISAKNLDTKFSKNESLTDFFENEEDFIKGKLSKLGENEEENSENKENTKNEEDAEKEEMMKEYGFLKELIVRLTASGYPEDVVFVTNKTLIFDKDEDSKDQDIINDKIDELVDESDTKTVSGGVSIYRNGNKLKYVATEDQLDDAYYTMNENGEIVVRYTETEIQDANSTTKQGEVKKNKPLNFSELIDPYIIDIDFITALNSRLGSEHFLYYLSLLVSQSHIDLGIYENVTNSDLEMNEKYHIDVYEKGTDNKIDEEDTEKDTTQKRIGKNIKMYVLNVDNWVATIHNEITEVEGDKQEIYNKKYTKDNYEELLEKLRKYKSQTSNALIEKIESRINKFSEVVNEYDEDKDADTKKILKEETIVLTSQTTEYKLDEKKSTYKDNTDYFCGLIRNSTSTKTFSKDIYTCEDNNRKDLNAYLLKTSVDTLEGEQLDNVFQKFDSKGKSMLYVETGTNKLIYPDVRLSNESERQAFLVISGGKYDETINLIWDKLCGIKDGSTSIEDIQFKELEPQDINETNPKLKSFIKSMEGTKKIVQKNNTTYHESYMDSKGIPTTAWGINLFVAYEDFEKYLGDIVYTPAFYSNGFLIPDNIIEILFNKYVNSKASTTYTQIFTKYIPNYLINTHERDALVYVSWWFGNYGGLDHYETCIKEALIKSGRENSSDRSDRKKLFIYYDYLKNSIHTAFNYNGSDAKPVQLPIFLLYSHGLYYRRGGELFAAETEPLKTALDIYKKLVNEGYTYDENSTFYQAESNADDPSHYAQAQYNSQKQKLTINDYQYVTWVFKDLGLLSQVYTNYDSFMEGTLLNKRGGAEDLNKFDIVDNTGENGIQKTIKSRDDLLPGDIVIFQENDRKSIKIYGGRSNWIEMDNDTLEELKNVEELKKSQETKLKAKREADNKSTIWKLITPIANYKGDQSGAESRNLYGKQLDINNVLWVYRNKELANNYIYNDSGEYTDYKIENYMLKRKSSSNPQDAVL